MTKKMINRIILTLLVFGLSFAHAGPPKGLKVARNKAYKAYIQVKNEHKQDPQYIEMFNVLKVLNAKFQAMHKEAGLVAGIKPSERKAILNKLRGNKAYKQLISDRKAQDIKIQEYMTTKDENYRKLRAAYMAIYLPWQNKNSSQ
ncbi:MAG: hypothetical protein HRT88_10025 [Lentisphaeraceae bacterium]|nr:hypothetical protein [Lentisphaeraceae bacterium]